LPLKEILKPLCLIAIIIFFYDMKKYFPALRQESIRGQRVTLFYDFACEFYGRANANGRNALSNEGISDPRLHQVTKAQNKTPVVKRYLRVPQRFVLFSCGFMPAKPPKNS